MVNGREHAVIVNIGASDIEALSILFQAFMIFLRSINLKQKKGVRGFPFTLPIFKDFESVQFESPVVFFVGENGSGK